MWDSEKREHDKRIKREQWKRKSSDKMRTKTYKSKEKESHDDREGI